MRLEHRCLIAKRRREPAERDRRLEKLAIEVLRLENGAPPPSPPPSNARGATLQTMITDESLTVSEAVQRYAGANRPPRSCPASPASAQAHNNKPENDSTRAAEIRRWASQILQAHVEFGAVASTRRLCENVRQGQALAGGRRRASACQLPIGSPLCTSLRQASTTTATAH